MAHETEIRNGKTQNLRIVRIMDIMAYKTLTLCHRWMDHLLTEPRLVMTGPAKINPFSKEKLGILRPFLMGLGMTGDTPHLDGRMDNLFCDHILMTLLAIRRLLRFGVSGNRKDDE